MKQDYRKPVDKAVENARELNKHPVAVLRFPVRDNVFQSWQCAILLITDSMARFPFMHIPHSFCITPPLVQSNFTNETGGNKSLKSKVIRIVETGFEEHGTGRHGCRRSDREEERE